MQSCSLVHKQQNCSSKNKGDLDTPDEKILSISLSSSRVRALCSFVAILQKQKKDLYLQLSRVLFCQRKKIHGCGPPSLSITVRGIKKTHTQVREFSRLSARIILHWHWPGIFFFLSLTWKRKQIPRGNVSLCGKFRRRTLLKQSVSILSLSLFLTGSAQ